MLTLTFTVVYCCKTSSALVLAVIDASEPCLMHKPMLECDAFADLKCILDTAHLGAAAV